MDEEILESFLTFIQRCNSEAVNSNDYNIIQNVFKYIGKKTFPSINELAREANVSKASISRFIKKYSFENYQQFRTLLSTQTTLLDYNLKVFLSQNILFKSNEEISEYLFQQCLDNLVATKENLDLATLLKIVQLFKESEDITFLGDEHDLDEFLLLQIKLLTSGKCTYLFKVSETKTVRSYFFNENSVVVIINVCDGFFHYHDALENAKEVGAKIIYISQDYNKEVSDKVDIFYRYGVEWSINTGYVSLYYIGELLEKLCIRNF